MHVEVVLFNHGPDGIVLAGRTTDQRIVALVREHLTAEQRQRLARLEAPVRLVRDQVPLMVPRGPGPV